MIGILVSTFNRPDALARSLPQISALGAPVLVVDDGTAIGPGIVAVHKCAIYDCHTDYLRLPRNRGLAAAMNVGISFWIADKSIEWISYFQDDVDVHPKTLEILARLQPHGQILSGHDAPEHRPHNTGEVDGIPVKYKWAIRATHIHAHVDFWRSIYPIPTNQIGTPKRNGSGRGIGSNSDWWICRDAPQSCQRTKRPVICVPGLVRSFLHKAEDSCWNNESKGGEESPLRTDL
jgi:glycosyltransferase involved in cell wall biosynthesis